MIDVNQTIDIVKLRFYNEWLYNNHIYDDRMVYEYREKALKK